MNITYGQAKRAKVAIDQAPTKPTVRKRPGIVKLLFTAGVLAIAVAGARKANEIIARYADDDIGHA